MEKKNKTEKGKEGKKAHSRLALLDPPARSSRPAPLARAAAGRPNSRGQPSLRPSTLPTPARLPAPLAAAAAGPHLSDFPIHLPRAHASTARATEGRQRWQEWARGSRQGHGLVPPCAALTQPHATVGCDARASDHPSISIHHSPSSMAELGYKSPGLGSP